MVVIQLAELEDQLSERTTLHTQTLLKKEEVERELANQEANVRTLQEMIRQLEEELEAKTLEEQQVREVGTGSRRFNFWIIEL